LGCVRVCIRNASQVQRIPSQRIAALVDVYVCVFFSLVFLVSRGWLVSKYLVSCISLWELG
jgi:hypothetical protein